MVRTNWKVSALAALFALAVLCAARAEEVKPTDEGKAASLKRVGLNEPDALFGNSIHDLAMLEIAKKAFPVNPSPALLDAAARHGWRYFRPAAAEGVPATVAGE